jgi:hypothetical protein
MTESTSTRTTRRIMGTLLALVTAFALSIGVAQATQPAQPAQPTQPTQPAQPTEPVTPAQPTDPDDEDEAVQPDMPAAPQLPVQTELGTLPPDVDPEETVIQLGQDETVTQQQFAREFDRAMRSLALQQGIPYTQETRELFDRFRGEFLEMYATQQALLQEARDRGIEITDQEVDQQIDMAREAVGDEQFEQTLRDLGYDGIEAYRMAVREGIMAQRVADEFRGEIAVTDEELQAYHEANRARYFQDREFDEARDEVENRLIGERLNERFRTLRTDRGIETFADRVAWNLNQN